MYKLNDLTGQRFGRLIVLNKEPNLKSHSTRWRCKCDCGNIVIVYASSLKSNATQSCGCLWKERTTKHGMYGTRIYRIWDGMKNRCHNPNFKKHQLYFDKGIKVCDEWKNNFMSFYNWSIQNGYKNNLTIDRIDVNGNYEPSNCRWVDYEVQNNNRSINREIEYNGKNYSIKQLSEIYKIKKETLNSRLRNGWSIEKTLTTPVRKRRC